MKDKSVFQQRPKDHGRRDFLRMGAWLGVGTAILSTPSSGQVGSRPIPDNSPVRSVRLGNTGVEISDLGFGTFALRDTDSNVALVRYALDRGITHFDTAEGYLDGQSERALGRALQGQRNRVTLTTKLWADENDREQDLMARLDESLRRLRTDRVDFLLNHAVDSPARMANPEWQGFVARAKRDGKVRFSGMSGHGPNLVSCLESALAEGQLDVILVAYNYIQSPDFLDSARVWIQKQFGAVDWVALQPGLVHFLNRAQQAGVGVMT
ncbi:aldo/keto reductase, partial [Myxococcota bacterium]|nr:aldo/keto reductase [Myxococcota bacterium]